MNPTILFDKEKALLEFSGESYADNAYFIYQERIAEVVAYLEKHKALTVNFRFIYLDTKSSAGVADLLRKVKYHQEMGKEITVNWFYPENDDTDLREEGEDFETETGMEIHLIAY